MPFGASRLAFLAKTAAEEAAAGGITYRSDTYASNVYLALPFDETNELNDVSPDINSSSTQATLTNGANSSVTNAEVYWTSAPNYGKALENVATAATQSMAYGLSTSIPSSASGTFVIEGWFKADDATSNNNWAISSADSGGRFLFGINNSSSTNFANENNIGLGDTNWHHVAIVCDSGTKRLYIDGVYKQATTGGNTDWYSTNTGFSTLHIGQFNAGDNNDFRGHIQDFRVTIGSNRGYTGTNTGTANFTLPQSMVESFAAAAAEAFSADGVEIAAGGYLEANGSHTNNMSSTSRAGTFSFWFKDINYGTRTGTLRIFTGHDANDYYIAGPQLWTDSSGNLTIYGYRGINNGWVMQLGVTGWVTDSDWHHCAIAYDRTTAQSNAQVYLDGASQTVSVTRYSDLEDGWHQKDHTRFGSYGSTNSGDEGMAIAQFWYDDTFTDIGANIDKFYDSTNSGAVDMGTDGTASGLSAPAIYHYGNTSTFYTNNGRTSGNNIAYTLTANGTVTDTSTTSRNAITVTANGNAQVDTTQTYLGTGSAQFDGSGDYLDADGPNLGSGEWTIEMFARFDSVSGVRVLYDDRESANTSTGTILLYTNGTTLYFNSQQVNKISGGPLATNTWYHIAVVRDSSNDVKMYLDGTQIGSSYNDTNTFAQPDSEGWFGMNHQSPNNHMFDGYLDEIRFSNTARYTGAFTPTAAAFTNDANTLLLLHCDGADGSTTFTDDNGAAAAGRTAKTVTVNGDAQVSTAQSKFGGASLYSDGATDYLAVTADSDFVMGSNDFTLECWVRPASTGVGSGDQIISKWSGGNGYSYGLTYGSSSPKNNIRALINDTGGIRGVNMGSNPLTVDAWNHVALVVESGTLALYANGNRLGTTSVTAFVDATNTDITISALGGGSYSPNHYQDEVRISDIARYSGSTYTVPTSAFTNDANTLLLLHMDGANGSTTFEDDNS